MEAVQKLQKAGLKKEMAEAIVEVLADCIHQCINGTLATKAEVAALELSTKTEISKLSKGISKGMLRLTLAVVGLQFTSIGIMAALIVKLT